MFQICLKDVQKTKDILTLRAARPTLEDNGDPTKLILIEKYF